MLVIHIIVAILSLIWATVTFMKPTTPKLRISYGFTSAVILSGTLLVMMNHAVILQACTSGLLYLTSSLWLTILTRRKLASQLTT